METDHYWFSITSELVEGEKALVEEKKYLDEVIVGFFYLSETDFTVRNYLNEYCLWWTTSHSCIWRFFIALNTVVDQNLQYHSTFTIRLAVISQWKY